jgi:hypothetical protein
MKRIGLLSSLAGLYVVGICGGAPLASAAESKTADIVGIVGSVTVAGQPASVHQKVSPSQVIATGAASKASLYLGINGPNLFVLENSSVTINDLTADESGSEPVISTKINIASGGAAGVVRKTSSQSVYTVTTPVSTASIRGTKYVVLADGKVAVTEGCVTVTYKGNTYDVCAGQAFDPNIPGVVDNSNGMVVPIPNEITGNTPEGFGPENTFPPFEPGAPQPIVSVRPVPTIPPSSPSSSASGTQGPDSRRSVK